MKLSLQRMDVDVVCLVIKKERLVGISSQSNPALSRHTPARILLRVTWLRRPKVARRSWGKSTKYSRPPRLTRSR